MPVYVEFVGLREVALLEDPPASEPEPASSAIAIEEIRLRIMIVASALAVAALSSMLMAWARVY